MEKCLLDYFKEAAGAEQLLAQRVVKTLAANGIYTMDILMEKKPNEIYALKGVGDKAMKLIGIVMTKEEYERKQKQDIYKKNCHDCTCVTLKDWFKKAGCTHLEACNIERILKNNGVNTIDDFLGLKKPQMSGMKGMGEKRMAMVYKTQRIIRLNQRKTLKNAGKKLGEWAAAPLA